MGRGLQRGEGTGEEWVLELQATSLTGEVDRYWEAQEAALGREREAVRKEVGETVSRVEGWVQRYRGTVTGATEVAVRSGGEEGDEGAGGRGDPGRGEGGAEGAGTGAPDLRRSTDEMADRRSQVAHSYRIFAQEDQDALTTDAHAAAVEAEAEQAHQPDRRVPAPADATADAGEMEGATGEGAG